MKIRNYDHFLGREPLPSIRCLLAGAAGSGKTNLLFNFILNDDLLHYDRLYIYSKTLNQPKYRFLQSLFEDVEGDLGKQVAFFHNSQADLLAPEELDASYRNLIVFDDVLLDKQNNIERYFAQGRHSNADIFYCCQSYSRVPKQVVRDNSNMLIIFPQDDLNLKHIYENHVGGDMDFNEFKILCRWCWDKPFSFLTIDKTSSKDRYKKMFDPL